MSLGEILTRAARAAPDAVAFVHHERRLTYVDWDRLSDRAAAAFATMGLRPGDVVAIRLPQCFEYPISYLGAAKAGLATAGINTRLGEREVGHVLENSGATVLVGDGDHPRAIDPQELLAADENEARRADIGHDDPVTIVYTSGTTGFPKGATFLQRSLDAVQRVESFLEGAERPVGIASTPLAHMGFMTKLGAQIQKLTKSVFMDSWNARTCLELIESERATHIGGVPTQFALMMMDPEFDRFDLSSLQSCLIGGAPAQSELVGQIRERFGVSVMVRYSCTELAMATGTRAGDSDEVVANTVGRPHPEVDLRIRDPGADGVGEVTARSPTMFTGYWRDPEATRAAVDEHGYFHTGDLGRVREDGNLVLAGRSKEMYIRGGYNVYPIEVENVLREHPKVGLSAVLGVPDPVLGERGLALLVPRSAEDPPTPEEIRAFVASRIADYKVPDLIEIRDELPLNAMFKVDKTVLRAELHSGPS